MTVDWQGSVSTRETTFSLRGGERHYHLDHLGTPRLITDGSGVVFKWQRYLPYGEELNGAGQEVMKYTGHERDLETGHDYMHARYYHEHLGRFLSVDLLRGSISSPQSLNRYAYVIGNPISNIDPNGLEEEKPTSELMGEVGGRILDGANTLCLVGRLLGSGPMLLCGMADFWDAGRDFLDRKREYEKALNQKPPPPKTTYEFEYGPKKMPEQPVLVDCEENPGFCDETDVTDTVDDPPPTDEESYYCSFWDLRCFVLRAWDESGQMTPEEAQAWIEAIRKEIDLIGSLNELWRWSCMLNPNLCMPRPNGEFLLASSPGLDWLVIYAY